jgi:signal transduction histidine kinase
MVVTLRKPRFPWRIVVPLLVTLTGVALTAFAWISEQREIRANRQRLFETTARSTLENLDRRVRRVVTDVREQGKYWQLYGLGSVEAWKFQSTMFLSGHRGAVWLCWVGRDTNDVRIVASDSTHWPDSEAIAYARRAIDESARLDVTPLGSDDAFYVGVPVRTPEDSLGVVLAGVRVDSLVVATWSPLQAILALDLHSPDGRLVWRVGSPAEGVPDAMVLRENVSMGTGELWRIDFRPTSAYYRIDQRPPLQAFPIAGVLLSLALGALAFQFLKLHEYSGALRRANQTLDERLRELSYADQRLRESNAQLERHVAQRTAQLNEAVEEISAFSHSMSHDLRSPIGAILNFAGVLEEDYRDRLGDEGVRILRRVRTSGETATRLLDRLVQFLWVGRKEPERKALDMNELAKAAWGEAAGGDASNVNVRLDLEPLPPATGDPDLVHRVLVNLMSNALKYTRGRDVRSVHISGERVDGWCTYAVTDNGVGFDPEDGASIFEPFRRLHEAARFEGTGLGLAIAAKIVRRHGGTITAESDGATGARFEFTLPSRGGTG